MSKTSILAFGIAVAINFGLFSRGTILIFGGSDDEPIDPQGACLDYLDDEICQTSAYCQSKTVYTKLNDHCRNWLLETNGTATPDPAGGHCNQIVDGQGFCNGHDNYINGYPSCLKLPCAPF